MTPDADEREQPERDDEEQARLECDRPGWEGGVNFWDLWKAQRRDDFEERP